MTDERSDLDAMTRAVQEWRRSHPNATFREMERAVEEQVSTMRASMRQEIANDRGAEIKLCPPCGRRRWRRGEYTRELELPGGLPIELSRDSHTCPHCALGLFPSGGRRDIGDEPRRE